MWDTIAKAISQSIDRPFAIDNKRSIGGGCINDAKRIDGNGRSFFVKTNNTRFEPLFKLEAAALDELHASETIRVPKPIAYGATDKQAYLVLEYIQTGNPTRAGWEGMGRALASMHALERPFFGWHHDNVIGSTPQPNSKSDHWIEFFRANRLEHQIRLCHNRGLRLDGTARLLNSLPFFFDSHLPFPSLLHGDLWSGNAAFDANGQAFIFDPCTYYGDRETDLAFTEFFGGYDRAFYHAYNDAFPLDSGYDARKHLYNLYHCLNHYYLFGGAYAAQAQTMVDQLL